MVNELATRLDVTSVALCEAMAQRKELAEQNATLREDVTSWAKECARIEEPPHQNAHQHALAGSSARTP